jgi:squalene-associated FAD-dependent desaturase
MNVAIIGAGLAGLACGCELADAGHRVTLFERRPWPGGKAYSFVDDETGESVDNGQHIFMSCTTAYIDFLRRIGTLHMTKRQRRLRVAVFDARGRRSDLSAMPLPPPLHLAASFATYRHLSLADRARVVRGVSAIMRVAPDRRADMDGLTFADWLRGHGQSDRVIRDFWDLIVVPALNCRSEDASASQALFLFHEGFLASAEAAAVGVPMVGLSELHAEPAVRYIEARGGQLAARSAIESIDLRGGRVEAVVDASGERRVFDAYVSALPPAQLLAALPPETRPREPFASLASMRTSPIVNLHLWFDRPVAPFAFAAFTGSDLQWMFNRTRIAGGADGGEEHLVLSQSAADRYVHPDKPQLIALLLPQLQRAIPAVASARLVRSALIKELDATFVPYPGLRRPGPITPVENLFLAGAYTDTGWPATMESAVRSGQQAAHAVAAWSPQSQPAPVTAA